MPMVIELPENGTPTRTELDSKTAAYLAQLDLVEVRPDVAGTWLLVPRPNLVGAVRIGAVDVVVRPKTSFASLLFMLGYARDAGFRPDLFDGSNQDDLWPMVGETLARLAERALLRGVIQGYVTRDDSLPLVRGRIRSADQMSRHHGLPLPLEVTYDEYDVDIAENQILRTALVRMGHVARLSVGLRQRLQHLAGRLSGARVLTPGTPLPAWRASRLNAQYQPALQIADVVLRQLGLSTTAGLQPVASFIVNMADVFEDFVTVALREVLLPLSPGITTGQFRDHLDTGRQVLIRPDIVHSVDGVHMAVLDAKYKLGTSSDGYPTSDFYQMLAYCTALHLSEGTLVYAGSRAEGATVRHHRVRQTEITITTWPLDVGVKPTQLVEQIRALGQYALGGKSPAQFAGPVSSSS